MKYHFHPLPALGNSINFSRAAQWPYFWAAFSALRQGNQNAEMLGTLADLHPVHALSIHSVPSLTMTIGMTSLQKAFRTKVRGRASWLGSMWQVSHCFVIEAPHGLI